MVEKISIGLIDSGVDRSSSIIDNKFIVDLFKDDSNNHNFLKHGTFCAHLIQRNAPHATIYDLKVFDRTLVTSSRKIVNAITLCIENNIKLINLSLSVNDPNYYYEFKEICDEAFKKRMIIVASADNIGRVCLPAYLNNVIGVGIAQVDENDFLFKDEPIQIYANGYLKYNENGDNHATSYATARMTGIIANILLDNPHIDYNYLISILKSKALVFDGEKILVKNQNFNFSKNTLPVILSSRFVGDCNNLGRILLIGSRNEIDLFRKFSSFLSFNIHDYFIIEFEKIDLVNLISPDQVNYFKIPEDYNSSLENCDTIILGKLPTAIFYKILEKLDKPGKKIFSLYDFSENHPIGNIKLKNIQLLHKNNINKVIHELNRIPSTHIMNNQIPVLALINLTEKQNILPVELYIRQEFLKYQYSIGQISPTPLAEIFGFDYSYSHYRTIPEKLHTAFAKSLIESLNFKKPESDLIVVGIETSVVPKNLHDSDFFSNYTLPGISLLFGFQPDAIILIINELDEADFIIRNIKCIKHLFNTDVNLVIFNGLNNQINKDLLSNNVKKFEHLREIIADKIKAIKLEVKNKAKIPVYDLNNTEHSDHIIDRLINSLNLSNHKIKHGYNKSPRQNTKS
jgi:hypothetical protein